MPFTKKHLCDLPACYAAGQIELDGRPQLLLAPDGRGPSYLFDCHSLAGRIIREGPGGTMSMVALPDGRAGFLAVQRFFPGFQAQDAEIVWVCPENGRWTDKHRVKLPYLHRFDILVRNGIHYLVACTLCSEKKSQEDWSSPGCIYGAELPLDFNQTVELQLIASGLTRQHGFWKVQKPGYSTALSACDQGVFEIQPPINRGQSWSVAQILARPVSDIALCDIDQDGVDELATIEPFHGNDFKIYRQTESCFSPIYQYPGGHAAGQPDVFSFGHVVWGGQLRNENVFIGGCRAGRRELFVLRWRNGGICEETIETGGGPANIAVINGREHDLLLVANHEIGEGALFIVTDSQ
jgi:hypothetical protein